MGKCAIGIEVLFDEFCPKCGAGRNETCRIWVQHASNFFGDFDIPEGVTLKDVMGVLDHYAHPGEYNGRPSAEELQKTARALLTKFIEGS